MNQPAEGVGTTCVSSAGITRHPNGKSSVASRPGYTPAEGDELGDSSAGGVDVADADVPLPVSVPEESPPPQAASAGRASPAAVRPPRVLRRLRSTDLVCRGSPCCGSALGGRLQIGRA